MLEWAGQISLPVHVLLTKSDKLNRGPAGNTLLKTRAVLRGMDPGFSVQTFSSLKRTGIDEAHAKLDEWFGFVVEESDPPDDGRKP
jgi:GTP-binding protein